MRKKVTLSIDEAILEEIREVAQNEGMSVSKYIRTKLGYQKKNGPSVGTIKYNLENGMVPNAIKRFKSGIHVCLRNGIHTTRKDNVYRHSVKGGYIMYEVRFTMEDPNKIAGIFDKQYGSVFYNEFGKKICEVPSSYDLTIDDKYLIEIINSEKQ